MDWDKLKAATDHLIIYAASRGIQLNLIKLQRILYVTYSWHLAFTDGRRLFDEHFRAWKYGPVNQRLQRHFGTLLHPSDQIGLEHRFHENPLDALQKLTEEEIEHLDMIMSVYGELSAQELERILYRDWPWMEARQGLARQEESDRAITDDIILGFYRERVRL